MDKRSKEELLKWFEERQKNPIYVDSEEFDGMSICYANPCIKEQDMDNVTQLASVFHDEWRKSRLKTDGTYEPRLKDNGCAVGKSILLIPFMPTCLKNGRLKTKRRRNG